MVYSHNAPFRADVVGSYLRPAELKAAREDFAAGKIDAAALKAVEDKAITELVAKQKAAGLHVITDGEFRIADHLAFLAREADDIAAVRQRMTAARNEERARWEASGEIGARKKPCATTGQEVA